MTGGQHACSDPTLHRGGQPEQADRVRDLRPRTTDAPGQLLVRGPELVEQLLVGSALLERVELLAVQVLQERVAQHRVVGGVAHDRGDRPGAGYLRGAPAALAHDQLVGLRTELAHDDRLQQPDLGDAVHQLAERRLVEVLPRLQRVRHDLVQWQLGEAGAEHRLRGCRRVGGRRRDQGAQSATETTGAASRRHAAPRTAISRAASR